MIIIAVASSVSMTVFSQEQLKVRGEVTNIDETSKSITIKPRGEAAVTIILDNAASLAKVKIGDQAELKYTVKDGVNSASKIRKLIEGCP
jgi:Cu/Ag efflux protein CusF